MFAYFSLFIIPTISLFIKNKLFKDYLYFLMYVYFVIFIGLRFDIGPDWPVYFNNYNLSSRINFSADKEAFRLKTS